MTPDYPKPIAPPPELVRQWLADFYGPATMPGLAPGEMALHLADVAARWGADQELEACCEWVNTWCTSRYLGDAISADVLRAHRRPEPPSLKEQALQELEQLRGDANSMGMGFDAPAIRRALEQLDD